jgi:hypothetical protein
MPLHIIVGSGFIPLPYRASIEVTAPVIPASIVLTTTTLILRSAPANVEPGLNPNHPKARIKVPAMTMGT